MIPLTWERGARMEKEIVAALIGIGGSSLIAMAIYLGDRANAKAAATMEMLREFHSAEMSEARGAARRFVLAHSGLNFDQMHNLDLDQDPDTLKDRRSLFVVARFFVRLKALNDSDMLQKRRVAKLFGPLLGYWFGLSYEKQLMPSTWLIREDIGGLKDWIMKRAGKGLFRRDPSVWQHWYQMGVDDRPKAGPAPVPSGTGQGAKATRARKAKPGTKPARLKS